MNTITSRRIREKISEYKGESIFTDRTQFSTRHIPEKMLWDLREYEMDMISDSMAWLFNEEEKIEAPDLDLFVYGPPSTGKTHAAKSILHGFQEEAQKSMYPAKYVYVNLSNMTITRAFYHISKAFIDDMPRSGVSFSSMRDMVTEQMMENHQRACFVCDEIDKMNATSQYPDPVDDLIRALSDIRTDTDISLSVITIANKYNTIKELTAPTSSRYSPMELHFDQYTKEQVTEILYDRCEKGFIEDAIDQDNVQNLAGKIWDTTKDLRSALRVLSRAGQNAQQNGRMVVGWTDIQRSLEMVELEMLREVLSSLNDHELLVLRAVTVASMDNPGGVPTGMMNSIYINLCKANRMDPLSSRHIQQHIIPRMEKEGIITSEVKSLGYPQGRRSFYFIPPTEQDNLDVITKSDMYDRNLEHDISFMEDKT